MSEEDAKSVLVPYTELAPEVLHAVVESYVLREGTDYGEREFSLAEKVAHVIGRLERGEAQIVFDPESASVGIVQS
ncbi:MAG: YheU family protein [Steroidobacteraceae bacterium]